MLNISSKDHQIAPPDPNRLDDPSHWRDRAEEARVKGEQMSDLSAIAAMARICTTVSPRRAESRRRHPNWWLKRPRGSWPTGPVVSRPLAGGLSEGASEGSDVIYKFPCGQEVPRERRHVRAAQSFASLRN